MTLKIDEIGRWTEVKLDIIKRYAAEYSRILSNQKEPPFYHVYIDAFAGAGYHLSETTGEMVLGSPLNALLVQPPFREYHLIDLDGERIEGLRSLIGDRKDVFLLHGNCNEILMREVFPRVQRNDFSRGGYKRGLCLLDPYGLTLDWNVISEAGAMKSIDLFINFPMYAININVLRHDQASAIPGQVARMNAYWGDESWRDIAYRASDPDLFGNIEFEKVSNQKFAQAFRERLQKVAGFKRVPEPLPMLNSKGSVVYYLFFASHKDTAENIVSYIFNKFGRGRI